MGNKTTYILGISCYYHDAAAALVKDGVVIAAAEEERFTRKKHDSSFPLKAILYCLDEAGITMDEISAVAFYDKPLLKFERILSQHLEKFPFSFATFHKAMPQWFTEKMRIRSVLKKKLKYTGDVFYGEHHMSHAAASFLTSPFKSAAFLTVDGVGEWATTTMGLARGTDISITKEINFPHSIGLLYSAVTALLGFSVNNSEYKVMGLSPYGKPKYLDLFKKVVHTRKDGSYALDMNYFDYHYKMRMPGKKFVKLLGPIRKPDEPITQHHKDIASSLQAITEEVLVGMLHHLHEETQMDNLCMAGGVALNSVANGKILSRTPFKRLFIQPAASDAGSAIGAALYVYNTILGNRRVYHQKTAYLGPGFSRAEIKAFLDKHGINYATFKNEKQLVKTTAKLINEDKVIAWFQGRMEWGPRALGARSILSNPCNPKMQDILNAKVKHREMFRPFAPVICVDDAPEYFECDMPVPQPTDFMLMVYPIKREKRKLIPAVTHVDGSGRLQTIRREQNPLYHDLIKAFGKLSGVPILINTSFNIRGEPIVCTPYEAYRCMMGTGIDYLVIDNFIIPREKNPQHMWDSEYLAKD